LVERVELLHRVSHLATLSPHGLITKEASDKEGQIKLREGEIEETKQKAEVEIAELKKRVECLVQFDTCGRK